MNPKLHTALRIAFALFLIGSGAKHLYTVYAGDPSFMATGYPEEGATAFVLAVLATKFLLPFICTTIGRRARSCCRPNANPWGPWWLFPTARACSCGACSWCRAICLIMGGIFAVNAALVVANWEVYKPLMGK